jgi:hypothetical protein
MYTQVDWEILGYMTIKILVCSFQENVVRRMKEAKDNIGMLILGFREDIEDDTLSFDTFHTVSLVFVVWWNLRVVSASSINHDI